MEPLSPAHRAGHSPVLQRILGAGRGLLYRLRLLRTRARASISRRDRVAQLEKLVLQVTGDIKSELSAQISYSIYDLERTISSVYAATLENASREMQNIQATEH